MASSRRGCSKAQMCFFKILHIISSTPPSMSSSKGLGINLNQSFYSVSESSGSDASATNKGNNDNEGGVREKSGEVSEKVENGEVNEVESEFEDDGEVKTASFRGGDSNCLDLLIEAVRVLSGKEECDSEEESRTRRARGEKRKERWVVVDLYGDDVAEEREPVVRSKRGRNQALPYRFRDSVVEPLKRSTRPQRPSSTSHLNKRLLRSSPTT